MGPAGIFPGLLISQITFGSVCFLKGGHPQGTFVTVVAIYTVLVWYREAGYSEMYRRLPVYEADLEDERRYAAGEVPPLDLPAELSSGEFPPVREVTRQLCSSMAEAGTQRDRPLRHSFRLAPRPSRTTGLTNSRRESTRLGCTSSPT